MLQNHFFGHSEQIWVEFIFKIFLWPPNYAIWEQKNFFVSQNYFFLILSNFLEKKCIRRDQRETSRSGRKKKFFFLATNDEKIVVSDFRAEKKILVPIEGFPLLGSGLLCRLHLTLTEFQALFILSVALVLLVLLVFGCQAAGQQQQYQNFAHRSVGCRFDLIIFLVSFTLN